VSGLIDSAKTNFDSLKFTNAKSFIQTWKVIKIKLSNGYLIVEALDYSLLPFVLLIKNPHNLRQL